MNYLMIALLFVSTMSHGLTARAQSLIDSTTVSQPANAIENEVMTALKTVKKIQEGFFAKNGRYALSLTELAYSAPTILKDYGTLQFDFVSPSNYSVSFRFNYLAMNRGVRQQVLALNDSGAVIGPRYLTLTEAKTEVGNYVKSVHAAQAAFIAKNGFVAPDLQSLGIVPPPHLQQLGQLKLEVTIGATITWKATFTPSEIAMPVAASTSTYPTITTTIGTLMGNALMPLPTDPTKKCIYLPQVKIVGVTNFVYSIDQNGTYRAVAPAPTCVM